MVLDFGGGIYNNASATLNNSTLSRNAATGGGGIYIDLSGAVTLNNSRLGGNSAFNGGWRVRSQRQRDGPEK